MHKLRSYRQDLPFENESISATTQSKSISLDEIEGPAAVQLYWNNGVTVDMDVNLEFSNDNIHWTTVTTTVNNITDATGSVFWDFTTGAEFMRVNITVNSGSADFTAMFNGKSR